MRGVRRAVYVCAVALLLAGCSQPWIVAPATYAADPYTLAEEPLRSPALNIEQRLPEPLASQLRTLVALHEDARLILAPVEVRFEPMGTGGRAVLRLVLVDPRLSRPTWIGEVVSDSASAFGPVISASLASKLANLVAIR